MVLIVCEGEKTEPYYFKSLVKDKRLSATYVVEVCGEECGSHPISVVDYTLDRMQYAASGGEPYQEVWCVFDRDEHAKIHEALCKAFDNKIKVALSNPCFEIWFLLHFRYSTGCIDRDLVVKKLKQQGRIPGYEKSMQIYDLLIDKQPQALKHARQLRKHHSSANNEETENPSTQVDCLVEFLNSLAK